jgi:WD40 repeat protein
MTRHLFAVVFLIIWLVACAGVETDVSPTPAIEVADVATATQASSVTPFPSSSQTPTASPAPTDTPTSTPTPTITPTPLPTIAAWVEAGTPVASSRAVISAENGTLLAELARWGRGVIVDIDLSADGQWLAVAAGSAAYVHNVADLNAKPVAIEAAGNVTAVSIAPNGDKVASVLRNGTLEVWQLNPVKRLFIQEGNFRRVQFSPGGNALAVIKSIPGGRSSVELRDDSTGELLDSYMIGFNPDFRFSPNGSLIAIWSNSDSEITVHAWQNNQIAFTREAVIHPSDGSYEYEDVSYQPIVHDVVFTNEDDLHLLVHEGRDYTFITGRVEIQEVVQDKSDLLFSLDSIGLLSGATKYVCNEPVFYPSAPEPAVPHQMELSDSHQIIALRYKGPSFTGDYGEYSSVRFHRLADGTMLYAVDEGIVDFAVSPDGETWIAGLQDGRLQIRRVSDGTVLENVDAYESPLLDLTISSDDQWVGAVYLDEIKVYRRDSGTLSYRYPANDIAFASDASHFALGYEDGRIELRSSRDGNLITALTAHEERVTAVHYLPSGDLLSAGFDCQLIRWQTPDLKSLGLLENVMVEGAWSGEQVPVRVRKFLPILDGPLPDGQIVIGLFFGGEFAAWSLPDGTVLRMPQWESSVSILAVAADGGYLAVPEYFAANLWADSPTVLEVAARTADFSPDATLLAGGQRGYMQDQNLNGAIQLWQVPDMTLLHTSTPRTDLVTAVAFTHDGQIILTAALDGVVRLWGIP